MLDAQPYIGVFIRSQELHGAEVFALLDIKHVGVLVGPSERSMAGADMGSLRS